MIIRIFFIITIGYLLFSLIRLLFFVKNKFKFEDDSDKDKLNEKRNFQNRFNSKNREVIELDEDQYKVE